jgi:hypothetical protein
MSFEAVIVSAIPDLKNVNLLPTFCESWARIFNKKDFSFTL